MALLAVAAWRAALFVPRFEVRQRTLWLILGAAAAIMVTVHVRMQYALWDSLSFGYHDIGLFARALHNAAHGRGPWVDSLNQSLLGEHACFLLLALVPFCKIGIEPFHLLVFSSAIFLNAPAFIVAWFIRRKLRWNLAAVVGGLAWLGLPSLGCLVIERGYGFQAGCLAVPLLAGGLAFTLLNRLRGATVCMLLAMLAREDFALTTAAWGFYVAWIDKRRVLGVSVAAAALAYASAMIWVFIPHYRGAAYPWIATHFDWQNFVLNVSTRLPEDLAFLATLLLPMAVLLVRPDPLPLVAVPALVEVLLTTNPELHSLSAHYHTPAVPVLFFAALRVWVRTATGERPERQCLPGPSFPPRTARLMRAGWCLLIAAWAGQIYVGIGPHTNNPVRPYSSPDFQASLAHVRDFHAAVPRHLSVTASYRIAAHFLDFDRLWTVCNEQLGDLVVIDDRDNWDASEPRSAVLRAHRSGDYQPVYADHHLVILRRGAEPTPLNRLLRPNRLPDEVTPTAFDLGLGIELVGFRLGSIEESPGEFAKYSATLIWRCREPVAGDLRFGLVAEGTPHRWGPFYFAHGAYPTAVWEPGRLYRDDVILMLPAAEAGLGRLRPVLLK